MRYLAASHGLLDQPGTVAFLVIFGMGVILFFVFRSMARHLRKINMAARAEAEAAARAAEAAGGEEPGDGANGRGGQAGGLNGRGDTGDAAAARTRDGDPPGRD